jgi:hypothetical protein
MATLQPFPKQHTALGVHRQGQLVWDVLGERLHQCHHLLLVHSTHLKIQNKKSKKTKMFEC